MAGCQAVKQLFAVIGLALAVASDAFAHDPNGTPITWNREISRIVYEHCASCHREGGTSFSLMTYQEAQPRATAMKDAVLSRRMPPWGAVKGFGSFKNDQGLTQQQIELVADWVEGGTTRGNNPNALPKAPKVDRPASFRLPINAIAVDDGLTLRKAVTLEGLYPQHVPQGTSMQIVATLPDGGIVPLIWLYEFKDSYRHPFLFRKPLELPPQTIIHGLASGATIFLIPGRRTTR
jgi:mono/diheme cytochrome c family protein